MSLLDDVLDDLDEETELRREYVNLWITVHNLSDEISVFSTVSTGSNAFQRYYDQKAPVSSDD